MVELDVETERRDCVTFVAATVHNDGHTARRITLRTDCRPVWPPRRQGVPAAGWDEEGVTLTVPAGRTRGIGFATPAAPDGTALTVAESVAVDGDSETQVDPTPEHVVRALGDPTPPADAVPVAGATEATTAEEKR
ncbi:DUF7857 domain-containing protein [Haloarchaeobius litoreus]|uniref:Uncharacterized protein n=1 Tax=Haloarchaeobius litoreus TaxID=755306 RepID=A0ABD6DMP5_9EURY|nr:hypothetical protein [Haloarchaeobius litoreus]